MSNKNKPEKDTRDTGFPPGSIGDVSSRICYDVREFLMAGFTHSEIFELTEEEMMGVLAGKYTIEELRKRRKTKDGQKERLL